MQTVSASPPLLLRQFLAWVAARPRTYGEAMDAWRTSCPRLSVWEDATADGLIELGAGASSQAERAVALTVRGAAMLDSRS
jgi:hypothetical protein